MSSINATVNLSHLMRCHKAGLNALLEGGSRSGKTYAICMFICWYILNHKGKVLTIGRDTLAALKDTTYDTLKDVWALFSLPSNAFNKVASDIHYNTNLIRFVGVNDDIMRAHGMEQDILWVNEAIAISKATANQMEQRTNEMVIYDYNPSEVKHWLYDFEVQSGWALKKTTMLDNPYVPEKQRLKILSYEPTEANTMLGTADAYMWNVYGLGKRAIGEATIFKKWQTYTEDPKGYDWMVLGGDFGYSNDPTALVQIIKSGHRLYLKELMYETGLLNPDIATKMTANGWANEISCWDSADGGKSVNELRQMNINAMPAQKGSGSIYFGIEKLKQFELFVYSQSSNLITELEAYKWATDKSGNYLRNTLKQLVPKAESPPKDHLIDSIRYGLGVYIDITGLQ